MNIKNFIFLDIETTGLPHEEYNKTRITEISLIAVQSEHISLGVYPRVQNKLTLCFNPFKMISPIASDITGLTNQLLEYQPNFDEKTCNIIKDFLELYRKPICFVAHNGNFFDYPILKAEFYKAGCQLLDDILCIDSLQTFRDLDKTNIQTKSKNFQHVDKSTVQRIEDASAQSTVHNLPTQISIHNLSTQIAVTSIPTSKTMPIEFCDGFDELLCDAVENLEISFQNNASQIQAINENTPKKLIITNTANNDSPSINCAQDNYYSPSAANESSNKSTNTTKANNHNAESSHASNSSARKRLNFGKPTYKLIDVYTRLTNKINENAHLAEQDVNMLIECAATLGQEFVDWANGNAKPFSTIPMMKAGKKLGL